MPEESTPLGTLVENARQIEIPFPLVPADSSQMLNEKEEFDYETNREDLARWLLLEGKDPRDVEGYSTETAKRTMYRVAYFERFVWELEETYIPFPTSDHADRYMEALAYSEFSNSHKHCSQHSIKRYFKWRHHQHGEELWEPDRSFSVSNSQKPQDYLTIQERAKIRRAALNYGSFISYNSVRGDPERRERLAPYVAEKVEKPIDMLSMNDWDGISSWKFTSMVWASLDAGLRPTEVEHAKVSWVDVENCALRIPKDESAKNRENWIVSIREKTAGALENWLHEREHRPQYDETDALWLTRRGNPYQSRQLGRLIRTLCDDAGIDYANRSMNWYSIRHSVGTFMTREEDLAATQEQLRHKRPETTMKYDGTPLDSRQDALDRMG